MKSALLTFDGSLAEGKRREFFGMWILATLAYGVGDIVSTIALITYDPFVKEGNIFVQFLYDQWGLAGFVGGKLAVFFVCLGISWYALKAWKDPVLYYFPPLVLFVIGGSITGYNIYLLSTG